MKPTEQEVKAFIRGMQHAMELAKTTKQGKIASLAIQKEITTLNLLREKNNATFQN